MNLSYTPVVDLKASAVILAGGLSSRFTGEKGLALLGGRPLIAYVVDAVKPLVGEVLVVVKTKEQAEAYGRALDGVDVVMDVYKEACPLVGALTGFTVADGDYTLLLACDTPFVSRDVLWLLLEMAPGVDAVIPRWPNGYIEPLQAVYHTKTAEKAAQKTIRKEERSMNAMIKNLKRVRYVSTVALKQVDPKLKTFTNLNTLIEFRKLNISHNSKQFLQKQQPHEK